MHSSFIMNRVFLITELQAILTELQDYFLNKPSNNLFILIVTLMFVFITLYLYNLILFKQLYWLIIIYTIEQCILYVIQDQSIAIIEHLFIYGSGRILMSQLWSVEAVNIIINIMPDKFTKFNAFQRSCHLSFKKLGKQIYLYFVHNHPLKVPILLSMPNVLSRFIALYCCLRCHLHCLNFEEVP